MSLELHAVLGFLQAIHHSARVAKVNSKCCRLVSRAVGKIRPLLEELDMAAADGEAQPKLGQTNSTRFACSHGSDSDAVHTIVNDTMGELQAVLESETMVGKFTQACNRVASTLQSLLADNTKCLGNMEDDINSISEQLLNLNIGSSLVNRQLAKDVRTTAVHILEGKCNSSDGHMKIRNMLYVICRYARDDMVHEMKGLERERSRAKAERDERELGIITEVIRALERRTPAAAAAAAAHSIPPQPPVEYLCPISHMIMRDPVILVETGQTYDRSSIEEWFSRGSNTCPITKRVVHQFQLTQNFALKSLATTWIEVHGCEAQGLESADTCSGPAGYSGQAITAGLNNLYQKNQLKQLGGLRGTIDLGIVPVMQMQTIMQSAFPEMTFGKSGLEGMGLSKKSIGCEKDTAKIDTDECKKGKEGIEKAHSFSPEPPTNSALEALKKALGNRPNSFDRPRSTVSKEDASEQESSALELLGDNVAEGKNFQKMPPLPPRRCSVDSSYTYSRVIPGAQSEDGRPRNGRSSGEFSRTTPLSRQGGVQFLQDAISTCRKSLDRHRPATPSSESARRKSTEQLTGCRSVGSWNRNGSEQGGSPHYPNAFATETTGFGHNQLFPGAQQNDTFGLLSASSYSCSMSSQSDSCDEGDDYFDTAESQNKCQDATMIWHKGPDFDALSFASLSTIAPGGFKVAPSLGTSFGKKSSYSKKQALPRTGAVNLLFDDCRSECPEMDSAEVSIPVLIEMIKSDDVDVATASANELAMRVFKDTGLEVDLEKSGLVEKLVEMLEIKDSEARLAAARTLGTLGEKCSQAREHIVESGASRSLADLTKAGSVRCMDVADWALNRLSMDSGGENRSSASVEVSTPMLVQMLLSGDTDVQASAVLDLKDRLLKSFNGFEGLTQPDSIWKLVDLLEHERPDIQLAAATVLSLLVFRSQDVHNQVATRAGTVIRLVRLVKDANSSCAAAAAQVLRTLAHGNSDVSEEIFARGIVPALEDLLMCETADDGAREVSAWLLGILGSHSEESQEAIQAGRAIANLECLLEVGQPHEVIAASWALQNILSPLGELDECTVSIPIVLESLRSGCEDIQIASVGELCHLANEGFWFQMEILKSGGLQFLLEFLESNPCSDGTYGALVTIDKLVTDVPSCPMDLCRDGGVSVLVNFLKTEDKIERQLAMDILLVLADRCPLHQPEVITEGAVPLLVNLLVNEEPSACSAAYEVLHRLANSDMSVVSSSMATVSVPTLLEILGRDGGKEAICGKEASARLIETISSSQEGQQELLKHKGMSLLLKVMETGESYILKKAAGNAVAALAKKDTKSHGNLAGAGVFSNLVGLLQTSRIPRASGIKSTETAKGGLGETIPTAASALQQLSSTKAFANPLSSRLYSHAPLPAVPESIAEESDAGDAHSTPSCNALSVVGSETTSCTCPESGATPIELESCTSENGEDVKVLVNILKTGMGSGKEDAATRLRSLAQIDKASRLELVQSGAVPLLVEMLQTKSFK